MALGDELLERERRWQLFHQQEPDPPAPVRDPVAALADLSFLPRFCPADRIAFDDDPEKSGIAAMRAALSLLDRR